MDPGRTGRIAGRQAAVLIIVLDESRLAVQSGLPLDTFLARVYTGHPEFGSRDRRLFSSTLFSYYRWKGWIDSVAPCTEAACVLASLLDAREIPPAITALVPRSGLPESRLAPMGGLALDDKARGLGTLCGRGLSPTALVPAWILPMLGDNAAQMIESFQSPPPTWLRVNPAQHAAVMEALRQAGGDPQAHPRMASAIATRRGVALRTLPRPLRAHIQIQDLASQAVGLVCAPHPGERWWDACCGSGGKTLHLAELGGPETPILATDVRPAILRELARRTAEAGMKSISTALWNGMTECPPEGLFDGILVDAPCSGTGTWHRNPDARWRLAQDAMASLLECQSTILKACTARLKPGGILVYATCSVAAAENEQRVARYLLEAPEMRLLPSHNPLTGQAVTGPIRIHPWDGPCNGMFIARFSREQRA